MYGCSFVVQRTVFMYCKNEQLNFYFSIFSFRLDFSYFT